jgi:hypothetical protein
MLDELLALSGDNRRYAVELRWRKQWCRKSRPDRCGGVRELK